MSYSITTNGFFSGTRRLYLSLAFAITAILVPPSASAEDNIYMLAPTCPESILVTDTGELTDPFTRSTYFGPVTFSHFVEVVLTGSEWGGEQRKLYVRVGYDNPLRTLKRGNRLERGNCFSSVGEYIFPVTLITGP